MATKGSKTPEIKEQAKTDDAKAGLVFSDAPSVPVSANVQPNRPDGPDAEGHGPTGAGSGDVAIQERDQPPKPVEPDAKRVPGQPEGVTDKSEPGSGAKAAGEAKSQGGVKKAFAQAEAAQAVASQQEVTLTADEYEAFKDDYWNKKSKEERRAERQLAPVYANTPDGRVNLRTGAVVN